MKRVLASILMTAVLLLSLLVPAGADHVPAQPTKVVPLWNADENWTNPGGFVVDRENQVEGEGCVSINLNGKTNLVLGYRNFDAVDATGVLALEFEMYISDLAMLDDLKNISYGRLEIGSGPKTLPAKIGYDWKNILYDIRKGCPRAGWNHVVIFLEDMIVLDSNFDVSDINFLQIYWDYETDCGQDWVLKFDNFVLTDRQVAFDPHTPGEWQYDENKHWRYCTECDKKLDETFHSEYSHPPYVFDEPFTCYACKQECAPLSERGKYAELIGKIEQLSLVCEDTSAQEFDLDAVKAQYDALMTEWNALSADEQSMLKANGYYKLFTNVKNVIADCEEINYILKENESLISDLLWLKDFLQESNWTWENWQRACDITTAARETVDGMMRLEKEVLSEYGYLAILEEAEDRVFIISDPPPPETDDPTEPETPQTPAVPVAPSDDGCFAVLFSGAPAMLALIAAAGWMVRKKKK